MIRSNAGHINFIQESKSIFTFFSSLRYKHCITYCPCILTNGAEMLYVADDPSSWQWGYGEQLNIKHC